jgi:hypothetical protein
MSELGRSRIVGNFVKRLWRPGLFGHLSKPRSIPLSVRDCLLLSRVTRASRSQQVPFVALRDESRAVDVHVTSRRAEFASLEELRVRPSTGSVVVAKLAADHASAVPETSHFQGFS